MSREHIDETIPVVSLEIVYQICLVHSLEQHDGNLKVSNKKTVQID